MNVACLLLGGPTYEIDGIRFEWNERFGPAVVGANGNILDNQPGPKAFFWKAVTLWRKQGKQLTPEGKCIYKVPREPQYVQLAGRHYVEVPEGRDPEEVRREWFAKLGMEGRLP